MQFFYFWRNMSDSDQILDKYAQLKLDLKRQEEEKQRKIQEELDAKNPLKQYEKIQRELAESKKKYSKQIKENIDKADEENRIKLEGIEKEQNEAGKVYINILTIHQMDHEQIQKKYKK